MTTEEIKKELERIQGKIVNNTISLWGSDLEHPFEATIVENYDESPQVEYNGWYEELNDLIKKISN